MIAVAMPAAPTSAHEDAIHFEREAIAKLARGDKMAFRAFVVKHEKMVFALLSRMLGREAEIEDLAQETFLRAFRGVASFDPQGPAKISTWLLTIATRLALDAMKRRKILLTDTDVTHDAPAHGTPEGDHTRRELGHAIERAAHALPDDQRAALVLAEYHGMSMNDIALALDISESTAKTRLFRAREKMRDALAEWRNT
jgi:RNA polymerase sigma-70 factor (ECF subfamily)